VSARGGSRLIHLDNIGLTEKKMAPAATKYYFTYAHMCIIQLRGLASRSQHPYTTHRDHTPSQPKMTRSKVSRRDRRPVTNNQPVSAHIPYGTLGRNSPAKTHVMVNTAPYIPPTPILSRSSPLTDRTPNAPQSNAPERTTRHPAAKIDRSIVRRRLTPPGGGETGER
jgi:hypothetical protein